MRMVNEAASKTVRIEMKTLSATNCGINCKVKTSRSDANTSNISIDHSVTSVPIITRIL